MTLKTACAIGVNCGLTTIGEAVLNIDLHAMNIFAYSEIPIELRELYSQFNVEEAEISIKEKFPELYDYKE